ncbi:bifunctional salicylyl-CoA 5-hydroxylase/oxidoreductase [Novosphingobium sp. P6W]|uniref:bifunctional salicylyl-CoA 5-hydroxylase/oxidoreductase n=1 Tax=Novosphingobium sp. P6W TaxID=1609758 RepID=UPI0005C2BC31|nr:bifunctional salicylyl-CoA 5-hydroxylase/oxidoreductase [Novosphingobium sp. P6W]AXB76377.1 bifunctional salicylyl-CoA 5-hydroxylase/oxidoreductase [Novosphingobium sp. P6W]KIS32119.1 salicylyl-CoA 5-hydroxylase [Novosphingobium sp. P6W]
MRIACLGGGPAGIYFAISMKLRDPAHEIHVFERNRSGDTFGWGVVFSDQTLANLEANDPVSAATITDSFAHWDDIDVSVGENTVTSSGHGFIGIGRKHLLQILQARAAELGVVMHFETMFSEDLSAYTDFDLIVAADGINSMVRTANLEKFEVDIDTKRNKFSWLGTTKLFDAFAFIFEKTDHGWIWAHAYRFDATHSTFIVECSPETWEGLGLDKMEQADSIAFCEKVFARHLDGHPLITNATHLRGSAAWINFRRVICRQWSFDNVVLLGDAAHTAHFSIGSGTKLALEDAIKLAQVLDRPGITGRQELARALAEYQAERHIEVLKIQNSARNSTEWFETLDRYLGFDLPQFAYSLMTRSQRVSHENLRLRDPAWLAGLERWFWSGNEGRNTPVQPMFTPYTLRGMTVPNRVVMPAMLTYSADTDGYATDFHSVHYGARALGGAGLVVTELLAVSPEGRATPACPGLWHDGQAERWSAFNEFAHKHSSAKTCAQIGHSGARAACKVPGEGAGYDVALDEPWPTVSASAQPWRKDGTVPKALEAREMDLIVQQFVAAALRADKAGFDMLEVQAGHGNLLSSFITPVMNKREDEFGGAFENRMRLPMRVISAVRAAWPQDKPLAVRISANDWVGEAGVTPAEAVQIARMLREAGVDIVDVSAGETAPEGRPVYGRMFQTPFADQIRNEAGVPTIAVGNIADADQVNSILTAGRADLVALGRMHLFDPVWTLRAAADAGYAEQPVPAPYRTGQDMALRAARGRA